MQAVAPTPARAPDTIGRTLARASAHGRHGPSMRPWTPGAAFTPIANLLVDSRVDFQGDTFVVMGSDSEDMRFGAMFLLQEVSGRNGARFPRPARPSRRPPS